MKEEKLLTDDTFDDIQESRKQIDAQLNKQIRIYPGDPTKILDFLRGECCGRCKHCSDLRKAQEEIARQKFWERAMHQFDDGSDWKPHHFGDLKQYSICEMTGTIVSVFAKKCERYEGKTFISRIYGGFRK